MQNSPHNDDGSIWEGNIIYHQEKHCTALQKTNKLKSPNNKTKPLQMQWKSQQLGGTGTAPA